MSDSRLQSFRSFLTERFTSAAVEVFEEVETIMGAYQEENKRLQNILRIVLSPDINLQKIDVGVCTRATTDVREQPPEPSTEADHGISETPAKKPKVEPIDWVFGLGSEPKQEPEGGDSAATSEYMKKEDPAEDVNMSCVTETFSIQVEEYIPGPSETVSVGGMNHDNEQASSSDSDSSLTLSEEESDNDSQETQRYTVTSKRKPENSFQKTMLEIPRMKPHEPSIAPSVSTSFLDRITEAFKDFPDDEKPLITSMGLTADEVLVDSAFGKVPRGCPLSYQCPVPSSKDYMTHSNAPHRPALPLPHYRLHTVLDLTAQEQEHIQDMHLTRETAHFMECATRDSRESAEELSKLRLTSCFRDICRLKPGREQAELLISKMRNRRKSAQIDKDMKSQALREYCRHLRVNWYPCGLVVHPNAPWLGALPDGLVYDPSKNHGFGLVHIKYIGLRSFVTCRFLVCRDGVLTLNRSHRVYWNIQGEMMVTGVWWCDLFVFSRDDILVQRIYRDRVTINIMTEKLHNFFFRHYMRSLLYTNDRVSVASSRC
ncbi:uncharacterized protein LOC118102469 [Hippoglossus stenolepis]|uniref:uncharacterized protein LOC118102469 n=1 Tax=Hippoglossus stenolepis TaxID=195615 RepID=UPI00159C9F3F|nr:uncharacterized protein LOC118102469 [Hippoglossus stenolepis]